MRYSKLAHFCRQDERRVILYEKRALFVRIVIPLCINSLANPSLFILHFSLPKGISLACESLAFAFRKTVFWSAKDRVSRGERYMFQK